jgi:hypothetical protein
MFASKSTPFIDTRNGGSGGEYARTLARAASGIKNVDTVITGHSPLQTWDDLQQYAAFMKDFTEWTQAQAKAGKTVDEAAAAYKVPEKYPGFTARQGGGFGSVKTAIQAIYDDGKK